MINLEGIKRVLDGHVLPAVPFMRRTSSKEGFIQNDSTTVFTHRVHDLMVQIKQGEELLASVNSQKPDYLKAQIGVLSGQRDALLLGRFITLPTKDS